MNNRSQRTPVESTNPRSIENGILVLYEILYLFFFFKYSPQLCFHCIGKRCKITGQLFVGESPRRRSSFLQKMTAESRPEGRLNAINTLGWRVIESQNYAREPLRA